MLRLSDFAVAFIVTNYNNIISNKRRSDYNASYQAYLRPAQLQCSSQ